MNKKKPVNLNLLTIKFPVNAIVSILHRLSGLFLFIVTPVLVWSLGKSLESPSDFIAISQFITHPVSQCFLWIILAALAYHLIAGVRHLVMDWGYGDSLQGGRIGARIVLVLFVIMAILLGVWIW